MNKKMSNKSSTAFASILTNSDIIVNFADCETAYISLDMKTITIPHPSEECSREIVECYILHEAAGHAVNTPTILEYKGVKTDILKICKLENISFGLVNLIEDERIERLLKNKHHGAASIFNKAYCEMYFSGKFDVNFDKVNSESFLTKLNIMFKVGSIAGIKLNEVETRIANKIQKNETFTDVINSVIFLTDWLKEKNEESAQQQKSEESKSEESTEETENEESSEESKSEESTEETENEESSEESKSEESKSEESTEETENEESTEETENEESENEESSEDSKSEETENEESSEETENEESSEDSKSEESTEETENEESENEESSEDSKSEETENEESSEETENEESSEETENKTEEIYNSPDYYEINENTEFDIFNKMKAENYMGDVKQINIPKITKTSIDEVIVSEASFMNFYNNKIKSDQYISPIFNENISKIINSFVNESKYHTNTMNAQFNISKSATASNNLVSNDTGDIDEELLFDYKTSNNIFSTTTISKDGKKHGFFTFLDASVSMLQVLNHNGTSADDLNLNCSGYNNLDLDGYNCKMQTRLYKSLLQQYSIFQFCKQENIPFECYMYTNNMLGKSTSNSILNRAHESSALLLFSTNDNKLTSYYKLHAVICSIFSRTNRIISFNGTPTLNVFIHMIDIIKNFKKSNDIEILNIINMTDGVSSQSTNGSVLCDLISAVNNNKYNGLIYDNNSNTYLDNVKNVSSDISLIGVALIKAQVDCKYSVFNINADNRINNIARLKYTNNSSGFSAEYIPFDETKALNVKYKTNSFISLATEYVHPLVNNYFICNTSPTKAKKNQNELKNAVLSLATTSKVRQAEQSLNKLMISELV